MLRIIREYLPILCILEGVVIVVLFVSVQDFSNLKDGLEFAAQLAIVITIPFFLIQIKKATDSSKGANLLSLLAVLQSEDIRKAREDIYGVDPDALQQTLERGPTKTAFDKVLSTYGTAFDYETKKMGLSLRVPVV